MSARRRQALLSRLRRATHPVSGATLARQLGVSRQVVVQDVAVLRAGGHGILATPHGYALEREAARAEAVLAVRHGRAQTADELNTLVDLGLEVVDVIVEHPVYGEMRGLLHIASREDVARFVARLRRSRARLLSAVTGGVHLHTIRGPRRELIAKARAALRRRGYLIGTRARTRS
jgi:transcriptional regulator of NAD metabolism